MRMEIEDGVRVTMRMRMGMGVRVGMKMAMDMMVGGARAWAQLSISFFLMSKFKNELSRFWSSTSEK